MKIGVKILEMHTLWLVLLSQIITKVIPARICLILGGIENFEEYVKIHLPHQIIAIPDAKHNEWIAKISEIAQKVWM